MSNDEAEILAVVMGLIFAGVAGYFVYTRNIPAALLSVFLGVLVVMGILVIID